MRTCSFLRAPYRLTPDSFDACAPAAMSEPQRHTDCWFCVSALAWASSETAARRNVATTHIEIRIGLSPNFLKGKKFDLM
ncbi:hypothetical protein D3C76_1656220 [compost metagenome]